MPRAYTERYHGEREAIDYCQDCWERRGLTDSDGDDHPDYDDCEYECDVCGKKLRWEDN